MSIFLEMISAAFYVMIIQNLIFSGGYGISEAVRMSAKPRQLLPLAVFITYFTTIVSAICVFLEKIPFIHKSSEPAHGLIFALVLLTVYAITMLFVLLHGKTSPRTIRRIGIAAFNTLVMAVPFINYKSAFSVLESIASGIGAGLAFVIAVVLINEGLKRLDMNASIPKPFKGTPALLIYTAILSLAFSGFAANV
mgnify:CR=1 FL=1